MLTSCFCICAGWLYSAVYIMECPLCSRGFRNKFNLKVHMRDVHGDDQGPFFCPHCAKQVKNKSCLRVHQYRHHQAPKNILHSPVTMHKTQQQTHIGCETIFMLNLLCIISLLGTKFSVNMNYFKETVKNVQSFEKY